MNNLKWISLKHWFSDIHCITEQITCKKKKKQKKNKKQKHNEIFFSNLK